MAEKPDDQVTLDEKAAKGKELFGRGARNYYVKCYSDAADDLSEACKLFGEVYGVDGDELGEVYLLYAKALIAVGQDENKLIEVPEEDEDEPAEEDDGEDEGDAEESEESSEKTTNGHSKEDENEEEKKDGEVKVATTTETESSEKEPQAGPSNTNENSNEGDEGEAEEDDGGNLEVAWEVLQNAALIFQRQEDKGLKNLLEVYNEMAGISIENGNFTLALDDFARALNTFDCLEDEDRNDRIAAEIHYKIGLCQSMEKAYDDSVKSFQKAHDLIACVIENEKVKEAQNDETAAKIKDLEETKQEILIKIAEIGETKAEEIEQVKKELTKLYGLNGTISAANDSDAGCSSSSLSSTSNTLKSPEAIKPKPTDISHLIKRKKPDSSDTTIENSPAKKKIVETSPGEKIAVPVQEENKEKVVDESATVQVAIDN